MESIDPPPGRPPRFLQDDILRPAGCLRAPTVEHFAPLFVVLGAAAEPESAPDTEIEGSFMDLTKRSFQVS